MKKLLILLVLGLVLIVTLVSATPKENISAKKEFCIPEGARLAMWDNQEYITINEPPKEYLDELKNKFIELGLSEKYFDDKFRLITADMYKSYNITYIEVFYKINTDSWVDDYINEGGYSGPSVCRHIKSTPKPTPPPGISKNESQEPEKSCFDVCEIDRVSMTLRSRIIIYPEETIYSLGSWSQQNAHLNEITNIISEEEAILLANECMSNITSEPRIKLDSWRDEKTWGVIYSVNGDITDTIKHADVDLTTGQIECSEFASIIWEEGEQTVKNAQLIGQPQNAKSKQPIKSTGNFFSAIINWIKSLFG